MDTRRKPFRLNRREGKMLGVCAGIADHFDIDVTLVRVAMILAAATTFPIVLIAYFILGGISQDKGVSQDRGLRRRRTEKAATPRLSEASVEATRLRLRDLDARMQAMETQILTENSTLAREIDALR